jgi:conjugal transfer/type IV secretion protein DotA/TraY
VVPGAWAAATQPLGWTWSQFFVTTNPEQDLAFKTLDRVFGIPNIYNSEVAGGSDGAFPSPFHQGLHELFSYYSIGVFAIGIVIIFYYVITIVAETAQTGTPFGRRFNHTWVPVRLMLAIALLAPIHMGMNIAQLGTLRVAKWGSSMATNGWILFNERILDPSGSVVATSTVAGTNAAGAANYPQAGAGGGGGGGGGGGVANPQPGLIAKPYNPTVNTYPELIFVARTCKYMYEMMYGHDIQAYIVPPPIGDQAPNSAIVSGAATNSTDALQVTGGNAPSYQDALDFSHSGDIRMVFGERNEEYYADYPGAVRPFCGSLILHTTSVWSEDAAYEDGAYYMQETYYMEMTIMWAEDDEFDENARAVAERFTPTEEKRPDSTIDRCMALSYLDFLDWYLTDVTEDARELQINGSDWDDYSRRFGWAGAAIWYNKIAEYNGRFFTAYYNLPTPMTYPEVMETVKDQRSAEEEQQHSRTRYKPYHARGNSDEPNTAIDFNDQGDFYIAQALYYAQSMFDDAYIDSQENPIVDYIHMIFGTSGLFNMRENIDLGVHPMAALVGIGSALIESTLINLGAGILGGALGGLGSLANSAILKSLGAAMSGVTFQIAMIGLSIGFIMFYVLPFLPFIYFFFAFSGWVKAVFEAMVGLPLWALAHLRINGEGISGPMAMDGFFLVLEIFVRPIVIVFALIASVGVFSAMVATLNTIWDLVLTNLTGNTVAATGAAPVAGACGAGGGTPAPPGGGAGGFMEYVRSMIDYLFYTVIYAIFVYMIGMSSFKLIDLVPNYVLRWIGKSLKTIGEGDLSEDPGQSLVGNMYMGSQGIMYQVQGDAGGIFGALIGRN